MGAMSPGVRLGDEPVLPGLGGVGPQPAVHRLVVEVRVDPVAPPHAEIIRCLGLVKMLSDDRDSLSLY